MGQCPGDFRSDCLINEEVQCHCDGEIWVDHGCHSAVTCSANDDGSFDEKTLNCNANEAVVVDWENYAVTCIVDSSDLCIGRSIHFGCEYDYDGDEDGACNDIRAS